MIGALLLSCAALTSAQDSAVRLRPSFPSPAYGCSLWLEGARQIQVFGDVLLGSSSVPLTFTLPFALKREVESVKDKASGRLDVRNQAGFHFVTGARFIATSNTTHYSVGFRQSRTAGIAFSRDMFNLVFMGNGAYEDQTAQFAPFSLAAISYNQLLLGAGKTLSSGDHDFALFGELALTAGATARMAEITRGGLYTAPYGEYVDLDVAFDAHFSDTSKTGPLAITGTGIGLNLTLMHTGPFEVTVGLQDFGFMRWNQNALRVSADTAVHFEGFAADGFFSSPDSFFIHLDDSLRDMLGIRSETGHRVIALPSRITVCAGKSLANDRIYVAAGVSTLLAEHVPPPALVFARGTYTFEKHMTAGCLVTYGGFGSLSVGAEFSKQFGNKFALALGAPSVIGLISKGTTTGLWASASCAF